MNTGLRPINENIYPCQKNIQNREAISHNSLKKLNLKLEEYPRSKTRRTKKKMGSLS